MEFGTDIFEGMDGCKNAISESIPNSILTIGARSILMMRFLGQGVLLPSGHHDSRQHFRS